MFHGLGGSENDFLLDQSLISLANQRGYLLAAPRGLGSNAPDYRMNSWSVRGARTGLDGDGLNPAVSGDTIAVCSQPGSGVAYRSCLRQTPSIAKNGCAWAHCQADDVAFAVDFVNQLKATLCVDTDRVFAAGLSNGGIFSWELAQTASSAGTFRAITSIVGVPMRGYLAGPARPSGTPALLVTGSRDVIVPPGQWENTRYTTNIYGTFFSGATAITRVWARAMGCQRPTALAFDDGNASTDCRTYCASGSAWPRVLECRSNEGHLFQSLAGTWKLMLDFFDRS